ncbi:hypothetical protein, variant [Verruconis gallopava]|uniref:Zn(2)-C6 fungal-type domain-containing protein n=1 Tax=Verruconis gallopava TaxID=253628 RepID=A0A0D2ADC9_9PEZI|nr:hypothetical protein, variant [Verruconis gallopava]KIW04450.1 hypothetical protein, variant [Verruconis gallopava]
MTEDNFNEGFNDSDCVNVRTKRTRTGGPRSKTGCITCRLRRVKCDETKPLCMRCLRARRECEGYPSIFASAKPWEVVKLFSTGAMIKPSANPRIASNKHAIHSFHFFEKESTKKLAEVWGRELWLKAIPRAAMYSPAMWHAAIAVGSAHEAHWQKNLGAGVHQSKIEWTFGQYNRAIRALTHPDENGNPPSLDIMISASIMFMAFEMLRHEHGKAVSHVKSGISMFQEYRRQIRAGNSGEQEKALIPMSSLEQSLRPATFCNFVSLEEARTELGYYWHSLMDKLHTEFTPRFRAIAEYSESLSRECDVYKHDVTVWLDKFKKLVEGYYSQLVPLSSCQRGDIARLETYALLILQTVETIWCTDESVWDKHLNRFDRILELCRIAASSDQFGDPQCDMKKTDAYCGFQLGNGIVAATFHTIWKARAARIRQKAIQLLRAYPRREAMWDAPMVVTIGEQIDEIERGSENLYDAALRDAPADDIPIWKRVRSIGIKFGATSRVAELTYSIPKSPVGDTLVEVRRRICWNMD